MVRSRRKAAKKIKLKQDFLQEELEGPMRMRGVWLLRRAPSIHASRASAEAERSASVSVKVNTFTTQSPP